MMVLDKSGEPIAPATNQHVVGKSYQPLGKSRISGIVRNTQRLEEPGWLSSAAGE
jgi:hypothetical protein